MVALWYHVRSFSSKRYGFWLDKDFRSAIESMADSQMSRESPSNLVGDNVVSALVMRSSEGCLLQDTVLIASKRGSPDRTDALGTVDAAITSVELIAALGTRAAMNGVMLAGHFFVALHETGVLVLTGMKSLDIIVDDPEENETPFWRQSPQEVRSDAQERAEKAVFTQAATMGVAFFLAEHSRIVMGGWQESFCSLVGFGIWMHRRGIADAPVELMTCIRSYFEIIKKVKAANPGRQYADDCSYLKLLGAWLKHSGEAEMSQDIASFLGLSFAISGGCFKCR